MPLHLHLTYCLLPPCWPLLQVLDGPMYCHPEWRNATDLLPILRAATTCLVSMPQYLKNEEVARVLTSFFQQALELIDAAGRADPEPALVLIEALSRIGASSTAPTAAGFSNNYFCAAAIFDVVAVEALRGGASHRPGFSGILLPEKIIRYFEAMVRMRVVGGMVHSHAVGLILRAQLQHFKLSLAQSLRLLAAWAALLGPDTRCSYRPTPHDLQALLLALRPQQLGAGDLKSAIVALGAFPWPTWNTMRAMERLAAEVVARWVGVPGLLLVELVWVRCLVLQRDEPFIPPPWLVAMPCRDASDALPVAIAVRMLGVAVDTAAGMRPCLARQLGRYVTRCMK